MRPPRKPKLSPLHTPKALAVSKMETVRSLGRDSDGAWRVNNRIDKGKPAAND